MNYLSVCSGIEAASVAWEPLGWKPLAFSEIEPFPRAVLAHHYPDTPLHGDFTTLKDMPFIVDADLLCGGTPCQAFSVAGLRESLSDERGNLTLEFVKLANAIDHLRSTAGKQPAWILWENVPGVLSTSDNAFGAFLGGLCGRTAPIEEPEGGWTGAGVVDGPTRVCAWRVLDAQHFGVAQRRKRVFVLAKGGAGKWAAADALLPVIKGSEWHPAPCRSTGKGVAGTVESSTDGSSSVKWPSEIAPTLNAAFGDKLGLEDQHINQGAPLFVPIYATDGQSNAAFSEDQALALTSTNEQPYVAAPILVRMREGKEGGGKGPLVSEDQSLCLATANDQVLAVMENSGLSGGARLSERTDALMAGGGKAGQGYAAALQGMQVRRLTPVECERLQGFPDNYTNIPWRGKDESPDGPRYKALGNSWAVPCARYIGEQIQRVGRTSK